MKSCGSLFHPPMYLMTLLLATFVAGCGSQSADQAGSSTSPLSTAPAAVTAATLPRLGTEQAFAVLGGSTVTNTGPSVVTGNLGVSPGSAVTGFPPGIVTGVIHAADAQALQAQSDTTIGYNDLASQACDSTLTGDLGGRTLVPGVYCFSSSAQLTGALTLNAEGNTSAVWVFKTGSTLTTASNSSVLLINGAQACNVFWQIGSSATLGTDTSFVGSILALTSITLTTGANVSGRALARNGAVTMDSNTVTVPVCEKPPITSVPPALTKTFSSSTISAGGFATLTITLSNPNDTPANLIAPLIDNLPGGLEVVAGSVSTTCVQKTKLCVAATSKVGLTADAVIPANGSCTVTATVTSQVSACYFNVLPAGALQTDHGNNAAAAEASLMVN
jgi:uncharacterized repeat protein (TIGR01451 family)